MAALELVLLLILAVLISTVLDQIVPKLSSPLIQIALGMLAALLIPGQIDIPFDTELFLVLFVAPILYDEARSANKPALFEQKWPVLSLAIGLVIAIVLSVGFTVHWLVPSIPLTAAFALGAALGPTDAIAVSSLPKNINLGQRRHDILQGEYLINDASGIVSFQFAIAATVTGSFSLLEAGTDFLICFFGGIIVGVLLGFLFNFVEDQIRGLGLENITFHVLFDIFTPFIMYLAAEPFGASGIIAVVVGGFIRSLSGQRIGADHSRLSIVSASTWRVLSFTLNGIVFVVLGTQLPKAMEHIWGDITIPNGALIAYVLGITAILLVARFVWLLFVEYVHNRKDPGLSLFARDNVLSAWLMTLAGPKGAVTLSIMLTTPILVDSGSFFPQRDLIIFLACGVILTTLLLSNFLLPFFAPKRNLTADETQAMEVEIDATLETLRTVVQQLTAQMTPENRFATQEVLQSYNDRIERIKNRFDIQTVAETKLRLKTIQWEKDYVASLIEAGEVEPLVGYDYLSRAAHAENMLQHGSGLSAIRDWFKQGWVTLRTAYNNFRKRMPGISESERSAALRDLQQEVIEETLERLQDELYTGDTPSEDVSKLILEYQRTLKAVQTAHTRVGTLTRDTFSRLSDPTTEIERKGLAIEIEAIQNMYDEGRITRAMANRMRERVLVMQIDLDDHV